MKFERGILIERDALTDVYRGRQRSTGQVVSMKGLREELCSESTIKSFERAGGIAAQLQHPNVVRFLEVVREQGRPYFILESLEGETLQARLARGAFSEDEAVDIAQQVLTALAQAHRQGLSHGNVSPSRIFLCSDGTAKLMDFGLSVFALQLASARPKEQPLEFPGRSPEQENGAAGDARSDVYAMGVVLTQMLAGSPSTFVAAETARLHDGRELPDHAALPTRLPLLPRTVSQRLAAIVLKAMHSEPVARFASGGEMLIALKDPQWRDRDAVQEALKEALQGTLPTVKEKAAPAQIIEKAVEPPKQHLAIGAFVVGGLLLLGALFAVLNRNGTPPANTVVTKPRATPLAIKPKPTTTPTPAATPTPATPTATPSPTATPTPKATFKATPQPTPKATPQSTPKPQPTARATPPAVATPELVIKNPPRVQPPRVQRRVRRVRPRVSAPVRRRVSSPRRVVRRTVRRTVSRPARRTAPSRRPSRALPF